MKAAAAPSVSAKLMIAPPWAMPPIVQRSGLIVIRAASASASALMNSIPSNWANGSGLAAMRSISDMRLPLAPRLRLRRRAGTAVRGCVRSGIAIWLGARWRVLRDVELTFASERTRRCAAAGERAGRPGIRRRRREPWFEVGFFSARPPRRSPSLLAGCDTTGVYPG